LATKHGRATPWPSINNLSTFQITDPGSKGETAEPSPELIGWIGEFVSRRLELPKFHWTNFRLRVDQNDDGWTSMIGYEYPDQ
jgi:hypothetical protein